MDVLYKDLLLELECPVCTEYMSPPIRQCKTGHNICAQCRTKLPQCPLCQESFTEARNMTLEALAGKMQYPCINHLSGCLARLLLSEKELHEKKCPFKKYRCPMNGCDFRGSSSEIRSHWESKKITSKPYGTKNACHTKLKSDSYYVNLIDAYDEMFWFKSKTENGKIYWAVQYLGDNAKASNYYYEIEVFKQGRPKCSVTFSDYCQIIDVCNEELFRSNNCTFTYIDALDCYVGTDQLLIYFLRVKKVERVREEGKTDSPQQASQNIPQVNPHNFKKFHKPRDKSSGPGGSKHQFKKCNNQKDFQKK